MKPNQIKRGIQSRHARHDRERARSWGGFRGCGMRKVRREAVGPAEATELPGILRRRDARGGRWFVTLVLGSDGGDRAGDRRIHDVLAAGSHGSKTDRCGFRGRWRMSESPPNSLSPKEDEALALVKRALANRDPGRWRPCSALGGAQARGGGGIHEGIRGAGRRAGAVLIG